MTWNGSVVKEAHGSQEAECSLEDVAAVADDLQEPQEPRESGLLDSRSERLLGS